MTARDLTTFLADLAGFMDGQRRARAAYARVMAAQEATPTPRHCHCGADLAPRRQKCDECRDEARRQHNTSAQRQRAYRARKAER